MHLKNRWHDWPSALEGSPLFQSCGCPSKSHSWPVEKICGPVICWNMRRSTPSWPPVKAGGWGTNLVQPACLSSLLPWAGKALTFTTIWLFIRLDDLSEVIGRACRRGHPFKLRRNRWRRKEGGGLHFSKEQERERKRTQILAERGVHVRSHSCRTLTFKYEGKMDIIVCEREVDAFCYQNAWSRQNKTLLGNKRPKPQLVKSSVFPRTSGDVSLGSMVAYHHAVFILI